MKKFILFVILLFVSVVSYSQQIIEYKGDTLVAITQKDLITINSVIVDYEYTQKELDYYKQLSKVDSATIRAKDSIIVEKDIMFRKKENYYIDLNNSIQTTLKREKRKYQIAGYSLGAAVVVLVTVILCK
jgi:hypothetical protein